MSLEKRKNKKSIFDMINDMFENLQSAITKEFEELFDFSFPKRPLWSIDEGEFSLEPLIDIHPTKDQITIIVDLPKVKSKDDIQLNVSKNTIDLRAKLENKVCYEKWGTFQRKMEFCEFRKTITLPWKIDPEDVKAKFKNGILEIRAKRINEFKSVKIED
ncbi:MAG: Hsp20/alpha crystallin family protein [Candidatus Helarchaeota archaeon]